MKYVIINVTLALCAAFLTNILLHEFVHYLTALSLGSQATLFHNYVSASLSVSALEEGLFAGLAPLFTLLSGLMAYRIGRKREASSLSLYLQLFGIIGIISFFGYLMISSIIPTGDTGKVMNVLGVHLWLQIAISVLSIPAITLILMRATPDFERFSSIDFGDNRMNRKKWSMSLILYPLLISIGIVSLLQIPVPHIASILATVCAPMSLMATFGTFVGSKETLTIAPEANWLTGQINWGFVIFFIIPMVLNRILTFGIGGGH